MYEKCVSLNTGIASVRGDALTVRTKSELRWRDSYADVFDEMADRMPAGWKCFVFLFSTSFLCVRVLAFFFFFINTYC